MEKVGKPLGLSLEEAALGILTIANFNMSLSVRAVSVEKGYDPRDCVLVPSGGGGALHAMAIARELSVPKVIIPPMPAHFSALGMLMADLKHDYVQTFVRELTGADIVVPLSGMVRSSGKTGPGCQPPAAEAHVDFTERTARKLADRLYSQAAPDGAGYRRFISFSLWRALSPPPQDWPLALCDGRSVRDDEGTSNVKVDVDVLPEGDALFAPIAGEEDMLAATIFHHNPDHRWWYFPDMTADEVIFIKFHDSDHSLAWRAPHTAFHDVDRTDAQTRYSYEYRGFALFSR